MTVVRGGSDTHHHCRHANKQISTLNNCQAGSAQALMINKKTVKLLMVRLRRTENNISAGGLNNQSKENYLELCPKLLISSEKRYPCRSITTVTDI